jgi:hypothetical protein
LHCDQKRLTGFPEGGVVAAAVEGISFPLEMEEVVDTWPAGAAVGAEASEAATFGRTAPDLAFLDGGSLKPSSLWKRKIGKSYERYANGERKIRILGKEVGTYSSKRSSSSAKPPVDLFRGEPLASSMAALTEAS